MRVVYWVRIKLAFPQVRDALASVPGVDLQVVETLPDLLAALPGAQALVLADAPKAEAEPVVAALDDPACTVRWMHFISAGREGFEAAGLPTRFPVTYAAGAVAPTVAEHAMALLLALARRMPENVAMTQSGSWDRSMAARARSLEGATLAIVGYGQIGRELAQRARPFGMRVVSVSRSVRSDALVDEALPLSQLDEALGRADAIVVAIAQTAQTEGLFNAARFAACKPGALFVNIARGAIVDQGALRGALDSGQLGGAGLDVTDPEPLPTGHPLWGAANLIISPHYAGGGSPASLARLAGGARENLRRLMAGEPLQHVVGS